MKAMSDIAFYIVDGIYNDEFDDAGEAEGERSRHGKEEYAKKHDQYLG